MSHLPTRRQFLCNATLTGCGLAASASPLLASAPRKPIRSCILVFFYGGPSHLETFDPKPDAPKEIRGEYRTIATAVPGVQFSEHLPRMARLMDKITLVRSVHHPMRNHNSAAAEVLTGRTPSGGDQELLTDDPLGTPTLGSTVAFLLGRRAHLLPYVALPYTMYNVVQLPGQTAGLLGARYDRFQIDRDPSSADFKVPTLNPPENLHRRIGLLHTLERNRPAGPAARASIYHERAFELLRNERISQPFDLSLESPKVRERYGKNRLGQCLLLARRLVESGVNFVSVFDGHANGQDVNWDSHQNLFTRHRQLIPPADQGLSALIEDLESRGLLDSTLILAMGEFGRTPKINGSAGRDHWPDCYTALLAGGGVQKGHIYGRSDRIGAYPALEPVTPGDLAATVLWRFGVNPTAEIHDQTGRPIASAAGKPIQRLFS